MNRPATGTTQVELDGIGQVRAAHIAAVNAGDAVAFAAVFAEDSVQLPPNETANAGRESIRAWFAGFAGMFQTRFSLAVAEVQVAGEWAFERGAYTIDLTPRSGGPSMREIGKYITVYQRQPNGGWQVARDIWNSDSRPPTGG